MKTLRYRSRQTVLFLATALFVSTFVHADVYIHLDLAHGFDFYYPTLEIIATNPVPVTYHRVESPSGAIWRQTDSGTGASSYSPTNDFTALINECTNGLWILTLNVGDLSEEQYTFSMTADNVTTSLFGDVTVTYPEADSVTTNHQPNFQWTSTSQLPEIYAYAHDWDDTVSTGEWLPGTATNWIPSSALATGINLFYASYFSNNFADIVFTTPTNLISGTPLTNWLATASIYTYGTQIFTITNLYGASFVLNIQRGLNNDETEVFYAYPTLSNTTPAADTTHEVESPNGLCAGVANGNSTSTAFATLADAIAECEAGEWTIYFDRNATNIEYRFTIDIENIDTNVLSRPEIFAPKNGAVNLYGNPEYSWTGPTGFSQVIVSTAGESETLASTATTWSDAPILAPGANTLSVTYEYTNHPGIQISWPTNSSGKALDIWSAGGNLATSSSCSFSVATGTAPYYILEPGTNGDDFTLHLSTRPYFPDSFELQCNTNLLSGSWEPIRSGNCTGAPLLFTLPTSNAAAYYRISLF